MTPRRRICIATAMLAVALSPLSSVSWGDWRVAETDVTWRFPEDHWSKPGYRTEWWYLTGHLRADGSPGFGYQLTFFRVGLADSADATGSSWRTGDLVMAHAAITDVRTGRHTFSETLLRATPLLGGFGAHPDPVIAWSLAPPGTAGRWTLSWNGAAFDVEIADATKAIALSLRTRPGKPLVFQGPNGYSRKGTAPSAASLYYSFTRLQTVGTIVSGEDTLGVSGTSWMDREIASNQLEADQVGWNWFALTLEDGRELMLYVLRRRDGKASFASGTLVEANGEPIYLDAGAFEIDATANWKSSETGIEYPAGWRVRVPSSGLEFAVRPLIAAQENVSVRSGGLAYWEGAVSIEGGDGSPGGFGYVELVGYGEANRPAL